MGSSGAGIWQSGGGLVSDGNDSAGNPRVFVSTGNGVSPPASPGSSAPGTLGDAVVRIGLNSAGNLVTNDYFSPSNAPTMNNEDLDLGAGGPLRAPGLVRHHVGAAPARSDGQGRPHLLAQPRQARRAQSGSGRYRCGGADAWSPRWRLGSPGRLRRRGRLGVLHRSRSFRQHRCPDQWRRPVSGSPDNVERGYAAAGPDRHEQRNLPLQLRIARRLFNRHHRGLGDGVGRPSEL